MKFTRYMLRYRILSHPSFSEVSIVLKYKFVEVKSLVIGNSVPQLLWKMFSYKELTPQAVIFPVYIRKSIRCSEFSLRIPEFWKFWPGVSVAACTLGLLEKKGALRQWDGK